MKGICLILNLLSIVFAVFLGFKVVQLRSKCMVERSNLTKLISEIQDLKRENEILKAQYYEYLCPEFVDEHTKHLNLLKENEVYYLE